ncbi:hypothetical protein ONZ45_g17047 [Pleurotus djamor]|nr:hypothetical protein ONZ45_g17047 [Pleurotus djamor]
MEAALSKIRHHTSSSLPHQKAPATLLVALESTLDDQNAGRTSTAYFATLLTALEGTIQKDRNFGDADVLPAELYLLALVIPFVPAPVIKANLQTVLSLTSPLFPLLTPHAPPLRSQITLHQVIFTSLDRGQLETAGVRQAFASILQLCLDPRPKVRKRAAEAVQAVLQTSPAPLLRHPYSDRVAEWIQTILAQVSNDPMSKAKSSQPSVSSEAAIHILAFLRPILPHLPPSVCDHTNVWCLSWLTALLSLSQRSPLTYLRCLVLGINTFLNPHIQSSPIYSPLLFKIHQVVSMNNSPTYSKLCYLPPPVITDTTLAPAWLSVTGSLMHAYGSLHPTAASAEVGRVWKKVWGYLEANDATTRQAAVGCLSQLSPCFTSNLVQEALEKPSHSAPQQIITLTTKSLDTLAYARAMPEESKPPLNK